MKVFRSVSCGAMLSVWMLLTIGVLIVSADDKVKTVEVDCTKKKTIAKALERGNEDRPLIVVVQGICSENVVIDRDDVTLLGALEGGTVNGPDPNSSTIQITGHRVVIDGLTVTGGRNGIIGVGSSNLVVRNCTVSSGRTGIVYSDGASGSVDHCTIQDNPRDGITLDRATAFIINSTISGNRRLGINVFNASAAIAGGNVITANALNGVQATISTVEMSGGATANQVTGNGLHGVSATPGAVVLISNTTITGNSGDGVQASRRAFVETGIGVNISNNTLNGIAIHVGGGVSLLNPITVTGNSQFGLQCVGADSKYFANPGVVGGITNNGPDGTQNISPSCISF